MCHLQAYTYACGHSAVVVLSRCLGHKTKTPAHATSQCKSDWGVCDIRLRSTQKCSACQYDEVVAAAAVEPRRLAYEIAEEEYRAELKEKYDVPWALDLTPNDIIDKRDQMVLEELGRKRKEVALQWREWMWKLRDDLPPTSLKQYEKLVPKPSAGPSKLREVAVARNDEK